MWPSVLAPSSPKAAASGAPPQPTRVHDQEDRARHQRDPLDGSVGVSGARRIADRVGGAHAAPRRARSAASSAAWMRPSGVSGSTAGAEAEQALEADRMVDAVAGPAPPAAELDHGEAERAGRRSPRRNPRRPAGHVRHHRRAAQVRARCRRGNRAGPPSAATMRSNRSAAAPEAKASRIRSAPSSASAASPPAPRSSPPSATVTSQSRPSIAVAAQEARGVGHLERVAGGGGERLVHVGDQRRASGSRRRSPRRRARGRARGRRSCVGHEGARAGLDVEHQRVEPGGELLRQDRGGDQVDRLDRRR